MGSTAIVFDKGHRIGAYVTSSSAYVNKRGQHIEAFEVHPNQFEPVDNKAGYRPAKQTIHLSTDHPSGLILPVVAVE